MRKPLLIGDKVYKTKKAAASHYKAILNSYEFGQYLSNEDYIELTALLEYDELDSEVESDLIEDDCVDLFSSVQDDDAIVDELSIIGIRIGRAQFNTKCFEVLYSDDTSCFMSYLMIINNTRYTPEKLFNTACRNSIYEDIRAVKQRFFDINSKKGLVKCQEAGVLSKWTELVVDHRQPNTFSIIVDRFKELNKIAIDSIEYTTSEQNHIIFEDKILTESFKEYHKEKANLRIVRSGCNSSRTGMGRLKRSSRGSYHHLVM